MKEEERQLEPERPTSPLRARTIGQSFDWAVAGVLYAFKTQRNMRFHFFIAVLVLLLALSFDLSSAELGLLVLTTGMVIVAEMFNTAMESTVDLVTDRYHPLAHIAKNVAAGGVLAAAATAVFVGYVLFFDRLGRLHEGLLRRSIHLPAALTLISLGLVLIAVVGLKAGAGPFRIQGGMPSGHAALGFALATAIFFLAANGAVVLLAFMIALLVAQSRVEARIHSVYEVLVGALIGVLGTIAVFQLLL